MTEQKTQQAQAEIPQDSKFTVLAEFPQTEATFERFEQGFNLPASSPGPLYDPSCPWDRRNDKSLLLGIAFLRRQPDLTDPEVHAWQIVQLNFPA